MLAGRPSMVAGVTFGVAALVTIICWLVVPAMDTVGVVTTLATLWGLTLALVIYLLTAKDTDKLLTHIDALQDQLSAALESPSNGALIVDTQPSTTPPKQPATRAPVEVLEPADQLADRIPATYLDALRQQAGVDTSGIRRAWTPNPTGGGPWVIEAGDGYRWSVFQGRGGRPTVIPLGNADRARQRDEAIKQRIAAQVIRRAKTKRQS